jgi:hypothetical protein
MDRRRPHSAAQSALPAEKSVGYRWAGGRGRGGAGGHLSRQGDPDGWGRLEGDPQSPRQGASRRGRLWISGTQGDSAPRAEADNERGVPEPILSAALEEVGNFRTADQGVGRDQQHGSPGVLQHPLDLGTPAVARGDLPVVPEHEGALQLQDAQLADELVLQGLVLMAVGDKRPAARSWCIPGNTKIVAEGKEPSQLSDWVLAQDARAPTSGIDALFLMQPP